MRILRSNFRAEAESLWSSDEGSNKLHNPSIIILTETKANSHWEQQIIRS